MHSVAKQQKNQKGGPLASAGFVNYVKKNGRGDPLGTFKNFRKNVA